MIRPPAKWHGGKAYLAARIIQRFPIHRKYLEPFGGMFSVGINKPPCEVEAYNDLDRRVTRFWRTLRDHRDWFIERARLTPYSEVEFQEAVEAHTDAVESGDIADHREAAFADFIRWRQSFGGQGKSFSCTTGRARGGMAGDVNAWWTAIEGLGAMVDRIKRVEILNRPAVDAIAQFDAMDCLIYADPPYVSETRASKKVYAHEMTSEDHRQLAESLLACKSKVVLSGYDNPLYGQWYKDWRRIDFDIANHAAGGAAKRRMTECIWLNFPEAEECGGVGRVAA